MTRDTRKFHVSSRVGEVPSHGGVSHAVWNICDLLTLSKGGQIMPTLEAVQAMARHLNLTPTNVDYEYRRWRRFNGFGSETKQAA